VSVAGAKKKPDEPTRKKIRHRGGRGLFPAEKVEKNGLQGDQKHREKVATVQ